MNSDSSVEVCNFSKSFIRWGVDTKSRMPLTVSHKPPFTLNHVRVTAECLAEVRNYETDETTSYLLGASCKTEHVNVKDGIWTEPNADFCMVATPGAFLNIKRWDKTDKGVMRYPESLGPQPERQYEKGTDSFDRFEVDIQKMPGRIITDVSELVKILDSDAQVISRTCIQAEKFDLTLDYPVKTVNYSSREKYYQVDTGPVILPDLSVPASEVHPTFQLAFMAHIESDWAEFLVNVPTPLTDDISVHHFSKTVRVDCENFMIALS